MEHHDLAHRHLRIWPTDQTSPRHHNPDCGIHHKHGPRAYSAHRLHKNCSQSFKLLTYISLYYLTYSNNVCFNARAHVGPHVFNQQRIHLYFGVKMTSTLQRQGVATPCQHWAAIATNWWCHPCQHLYLYAPLGAGSAAISHPQIARFIYMFWPILMLVSSLNEYSCCASIQSVAVAMVKTLARGAN